MTTLLNHRITLAYLAYLGFQASSVPPVSTATALQVTASRKSERKSGKSKRQVYTALLLGAAGSGKSTLMRSFVGKNVKHVPYEPTSRQSCVVNAVEIGGVEKYLVLMEYGREEPEILRSPKKLSAIDIIVYVYDSADTNSFSCGRSLPTVLLLKASRYISNLRQQHKLDHIPSVFVASKSDLDLAVQRHEVQPDVYCRRLDIRPPVACNSRQTAVLWQVICSVGMRRKRSPFFVRLI
jgi:Ras family protein T1